MVERVVLVGTNSERRARFQSTHLPAPFVGYEPSAVPGATGWVVVAKTKTSHGQSLLGFEDKPPYAIPSVDDIHEVEGSSGFTAVSTFSGCGGSSLGLKMAGFKVAWANEFIPEAANTYEANSKGTVVNRMNIREVPGDLIRHEAGLVDDDIDLFEGSPPCASFSTAGKREKHWGKVKEYSDTKERVDDLFDEYTRLVGELRPKVFLAENVTGLNKGNAKGYLKKIIGDLCDHGYHVLVKVLDAQWLGVPQRRQRLIFIGVRSDLVEEHDVVPADGFPKPKPYRYTVEEAFQGLDAPVEADADMSRYEVGKEWANLRPGQQSERYFSLVRAHPLEPSPTVTQTGGVTSAAAVAHPYECRKYSISELRRICGFPDDFELTGTYRQQYERLGRSVAPPMYQAVGEAIIENILRRAQ